MTAEEFTWVWPVIFICTVTVVQNISSAFYIVGIGGVVSKLWLGVI